jgi:autotransporter-associated beta strand protein
LTLTGANTYTGETIVSGGKLILSSTATLATSLVEIDAGTLGGDGVIPSPVLVERQGFLAPSAETHRPTTMTIQSYLDVLSNGTYKCRFPASGSTVRSDQVIANGIIGDSAGNIAFEAKIQGTLVPGTTFTIINNTSANPISATFANLPDGGIVTINGNNFKASYEGGDGNDLTLTVQ